MRGFLLCWIGLASVSACYAQTAKVPAAAAPMGIVTGHVICADTQRPARFAEVQLMRRPEPGESEQVAKLNAEPGWKKLPERVEMVNGRTGLDGSYTIPKVPPRDYYVIGILSGYVFPVHRVKDKREAADLDKVLAGVPVAHVTADRVAEVNLSLQRGGVIAGRVQTDDGSPVVGMRVKIEPDDEMDEVSLTGSLPLARALSTLRWTKTDDGGRFRSVGLQPGKYRLSVLIEIDRSEQLLLANGQTEFSGNGEQEAAEFYLPGALRRSDNKPVEIVDAETRRDVLIEIPLRNLRTITGRVVAKEDGHALNHGHVTLQDQSDKDLHRRAEIQADGSWRVELMPRGTYKATISDLRDMDNPNPSDLYTRVKTIVRYRNAEVAVIIGEHDVVVDDVSVDEVKAGKKPTS